MRIVKYQGNSLQKKRQTNDKSQNGKRLPIGTRKKFTADLLSKKIELETYEIKNILPQSQQNYPDNPNMIEQYYHRIKQNYANSTQDLIIQQQIKSTTKSSVKLPVLNNNSRGNKLSKQQKTKIQQIEFLQSYTVENTKKQPRLNTFHNPADKKGTIDDSLKVNKIQPFMKLMKIQAMKPRDKSQESKADLSVREISLNKIDKTIPIQRKRTRNQTQISAIKNQSKQLQQKSKTCSKISQSFNENSIKKQKKTISIIRGNNNQKKYSILYWDFCLFISLMNKMKRPGEPIATYKAYIGKGNNSILVKNTLKNRFWWNVIDNDNDINLQWTQQRDNKFLQSLKSTISPQIEYMSTKVQFILSKQNQKNDILKQYCGSGLNKLMSNEQRKNYCKSPYHVQILPQQLRIFDNPNKLKIHNHLQFNWNLCNKKALYYNMKAFYLAIKQDPFQFIPLTYHVHKEGDEEWNKFQSVFKEKQEDINKKKQQKNQKKKKQKNLWIIKPGENSNQGCGIDVADNLDDIREIVKNKGIRANGKSRSHIIQRYLMPFLYNKRKFDIRCYILVTSVNSIVKAYWYQEGYIRTSCKDFTTKNLKNRFIHLTNDAVQKKSQEYGKYQNGNKISFNDFQKYIDSFHSDRQLKFYETVYPKMMKMAADAIKATYLLLDAKKRQYSFQIYGLDFMIDQDFNSWLIEVNNNPCLQLSSPLLARIIPNMIENAFKIAIDPLFPPPKEYPKTKAMPTQLFESNKFTLIFNSNQQGEYLKNLLKNINLSGIVESDEQQQGIEQVDEQ